VSERERFRLSNQSSATFMTSCRFRIAGPLITRLSGAGIKLNVTAIMTNEQVKRLSQRWSAWDGTGSDAGVVKAWIANSRHRKRWAVDTINTAVLEGNPDATVACGQDCCRCHAVLLPRGLFLFVGPKRVTPPNALGERWLQEHGDERRLILLTSNRAKL
jgi:hypothetical protein